MRSFLRAASVCPTETDSTKPIMLMKNAGNHNASIISNDKSGRANDGRPWGIDPTTATLSPREKNCTAEMDIKTANKGPARLILAASPEDKPHASSNGFRPILT